jgi:hypothetical protein
MTPNPGSKPLAVYAVPDWLLGGYRKRRVLEALAWQRPKLGWTVAALVEKEICAQATAYEILRGLRPLGVLENRPGGGVVLRQEGDLAEALRTFLVALRPLSTEEVDRPKRLRA